MKKIKIRLKTRYDPLRSDKWIGVKTAPAVDFPLQTKTATKSERTCFFILGAIEGKSLFKAGLSKVDRRCHKFVQTASVDMCCTFVPWVKDVLSKVNRF